MKRTKDDGINEIENSLNSQGYIVLKHDFIAEYSDDFINELKKVVKGKKNTDCIFNGLGGDGEDIEPGVPDCGDQKRKQLFFNEAKWDQRTKTLLQNITTYTSNLMPGRSANAHVFLLSEEGCENQRPHCDYDPDTVTQDDCGGFPVGCIVALEDGTAVNVWPYSINYDFDVMYQHQRLELRRGDVFLFRGDLVHSGASYEKSNLRVHCFLDIKRVKRVENGTYSMSYDNLSPVKLPE